MRDCMDINTVSGKSRLIYNQIMVMMRLRCYKQNKEVVKNGLTLFL